MADPPQLDALESPIRVELLEHLVVIGPASVRELAERVGRSPHTVHYHVRKLLDAGLITQADKEQAGARPRSLYDAVADRYEMEIDPERSGEGSHEVRAVASVLRLARRDYTALAESAPNRLDSPDVFAGRLRARLSVGAKNEVMKHLRAIQRVFAEELAREHPPQARVETYSLTAVLVPEASEARAMGAEP